MVIRIASTHPLMLVLAMALLAAGCGPGGRPAESAGASPTPTGPTTSTVGEVYRHEPAANRTALPKPKPQLGQPASSSTVYWIGEWFEGAGDLPPLVLSGLDQGRARTGPGWSYLLHYGRTANQIDKAAGAPLVTLQIWPRANWDALMAPAEGLHQWDGSGWTRHEITVPDGQAIIFADSASGAARRPWDAIIGLMDRATGPSETFQAHVYLGQTVVLVMAPNPTGSAVKNPYNSRAGIEAVVRALRPRESGHSAVPSGGR